MKGTHTVQGGSFCVFREYGCLCLSEVLARVRLAEGKRRDSGDTVNGDVAFDTHPIEKVSKRHYPLRLFFRSYRHFLLML